MSSERDIGDLFNFNLIIPGSPLYKVKVWFRFSAVSHDPFLDNLAELRAKVNPSAEEGDLEERKSERRFSGLHAIFMADS